MHHIRPEGTRRDRRCFMIVHQHHKEKKLKAYVELAASYACKWEHISVKSVAIFHGWESNEMLKYIESLKLETNYSQIYGCTKIKLVRKQLNSLTIPRLTDWLTLYVYRASFVLTSVCLFDSLPVSIRWPGGKGKTLCECMTRHWDWFVAFDNFRMVLSGLVQRQICNCR